MSETISNEKENTLVASKWLANVIGLDKLEIFQNTWTSFSDNEPLAYSDGGKSNNFEPKKTSFNPFYKRPYKDNPGYGWNTNVGIISTDVGLDIITCNQDLINDVKEKNNGNFEVFDQPKIPFYENGIQVLDSAEWKLPSEIPTSKLMFPTPELAQYIRSKGRIATMEAACRNYTAQRMMISAEIYNAAEGKDYLLVRDGEKISTPDKKTEEISLKKLGFDKNGKPVQNYNGGAGVIYDGKSDFIIFTTDTNKGGLFDKLSKGLPVGGIVPGIYNGRKQGGFISRDKEQQFVKMLKNTKALPNALMNAKQNSL